MKQIVILSLFILFSYRCDSQQSEATNQISDDLTSKEDSTVVRKNKVKEHNDQLNFERISIPLDTLNGVPFSYDPGLYGYIIEGFEVDDNNRLYFMGGQPARISCFEGEKEIWRKTYPISHSLQIHFYENMLYSFDKWPGMNNIFHLDPNNGEIIKTYNSITENRVNDYYFQDSLLILNIYNLNEYPSYRSKLIPLAYDLKGLIWGVADSLNSIFNYDNWRSNGDYLGSWKSHLVYWDIFNGDDSFDYIVSLRSSKSKKVIHEKRIDNALFGIPLYGEQGAPPEHRRLVNGKVYLLHRKEDQAVVTILSLEKLFPGL